MKTLHTLITLSLLVIGTATFAKADDKIAEKKSNVPMAPSVWENSEIEAPEYLKFVKAKNAHVPIADFMWGTPFEAPVNISMVPVAPFTLGDSMEDAPKELTFTKANFSLVPVAPFVWGDASEQVFIK